MFSGYVQFYNPSVGWTLALMLQVDLQQFINISSLNELIIFGSFQVYT